MAEDDAPGADTGTGTGTGTATEAPKAAADVPDSIQSTVTEQDGPPATITDGGAGRGKVEATAVAAHSNDATAEPSGASTAASAPGKDDAQLVGAHASLPPPLLLRRRTTSWLGAKAAMHTFARASMHTYARASWRETSPAWWLDSRAASSVHALIAATLRRVDAGV